MSQLNNPEQGPKTFDNHVLDSLPELLSDPGINLPEMVRTDERLQHTDVTPPQKPPKNIDSYSFVPLTRLEGVTETFLQGNDYSLDPDIQTHFEGCPDSRPLLDGPAAIGIVAKRGDKSHLAAVAGIKTEPDGTIEIVQLQGVIKPSSGVGPQLGGFRWQETLVKAWEKVAQRAGATALQLTGSDEFIEDWMKEEAAQGSEYMERVIASYKRHYDKTAQNLGMRPSRSKAGKTISHIFIQPDVLDTSITGSERSIGGVRREVRRGINMFDAGRHSVRSALLNARRLLSDALYELESTPDEDPEYYWSKVSRSLHDNAVAKYKQAIQKIDEQVIAVHQAAEIARRYESTL